MATLTRRTWFVVARGLLAAAIVGLGFTLVTPRGHGQRTPPLVYLGGSSPVPAFVREWVSRDRGVPPHFFAELPIRVRRDETSGGSRVTLSVFGMVGGEAFNPPDAWSHRMLLVPERPSSNLCFPAAPPSWFLAHHSETFPSDAALERFMGDGNDRLGPTAYVLGRVQSRWSQTVPACGTGQRTTEQLRTVRLPNGPRYVGLTYHPLFVTIVHDGGEARRVLFEHRERDADVFAADIERWVAVDADVSIDERVRRLTEPTEVRALPNGGT